MFQTTAKLDGSVHDQQTLNLTMYSLNVGLVTGFSGYSVRRHYRSTTFIHAKEVISTLVRQ